MSNDPSVQSLDDYRRDVALFRHSVIADLIHLEPGFRGIYALLTAKSKQEHTIPGSLRRHVASETIRGWLRAYRRGGFDALVPRVRADQGASRSIPPEVVDLLCQMKDDGPELSVPLLIKQARAEHNGDDQRQLHHSMGHDRNVSLDQRIMKKTAMIEKV